MTLPPVGQGRPRRAGRSSALSPQRPSAGAPPPARGPLLNRGTPSATRLAWIGLDCLLGGASIRAHFNRLARMAAAWGARWGEAPPGDRGRQGTHPQFYLPHLGGACGHVHVAGDEARVRLRGVVHLVSAGGRGEGGQNRVKRVGLRWGSGKGASNRIFFWPLQPSPLFQKGVRSACSVWKRGRARPARGVKTPLPPLPAEPRRPTSST
jgi:hypothetical protein